MIQYITVTNYISEQLRIDMFRPEIAKLSIRSITGLGPVKANIQTTEIPTDDGSIYNSARAEQRNIVIVLGFESNSLIENSRLLTYKYFPLKKIVKFSIKTDNRELYTYGYVESNEPNIFSKDEGCQISLICPSAYFKSEEERDISFDMILDGFEFPVEVTSITPEGKAIYDPQLTCDFELPEWENIYGNEEKIKTIKETKDDENPYMFGNEEFGMFEFINKHEEYENYTHAFLEKFVHEEMEIL